LPVQQVHAAGSFTKEVNEMFKTILLPIDGSPLSARAVPFAQQLAVPGESRLVVVRAHLPSDDDLDLRLNYPDKSRAERAELERHLAQAEFRAECARLCDAGYVVEPRFVEGPAADAIYDTARDVQADLVVMSTHGRSGFGRWLYGSVADEVLRRLPIPILLISAVCSRVWSVEKPKRILVPLDGSSLATEVLSAAADLATSFGGAEILLLAVVEPGMGLYPGAALHDVPESVRAKAQAATYLQSVAREIAASAPGPVTCRAVYGDAAPMIASVAHAAEVDAVAIATHGRGGMARLVLGSVAARTLQLATVPVMIYKPVVLPPQVHVKY
jgi:nucleotide-binding universal stress UspA family protein